MPAIDQKQAANRIAYTLLWNKQSV